MKKSFRTFFLCSTFVLCPMILSSCQNSGNIIQNKDRNITSIAIKEGSIPEEVFIGQFNEAGIKLLVSYSDNTTEVVTDKCKFSGYDLSVAGSQKVKVEYAILKKDKICCIPLL